MDQRGHGPFERTVTGVVEAPDQVGMYEAMIACRLDKRASTCTNRRRQIRRRGPDGSVRCQQRNPAHRADERK